MYPTPYFFPSDERLAAMSDEEFDRLIGNMKILNAETKETTRFYNEMAGSLRREAHLMDIATWVIGLSTVALVIAEIVARID